MRIEVEGTYKGKQARLVWEDGLLEGSEEPVLWVRGLAFAREGEALHPTGGTTNHLWNWQGVFTLFLEVLNPPYKVKTEDVPIKELGDVK